METLSNNFGAKKGKKGQNEYYCNFCDVQCYKKYSWERHLSTAKHIKATNVTNLKEKGQQYICQYCNKIYTNRTSLWRHNKNCIEINVEEKQDTEIVIKEKSLEPTVIYNIVKQITESNESIFKNQLNETNKQSLELQKDMFGQIIELLKTNLSNTTNNNINNGQITNNHFNLNIFLNETCKNAMNVDQFIEYIQPTLQELEDTARLGYVEGITRIILRGLKDLEENERPFHCSDLKRETMFVKNNNDIWEKESDEKPQLMKVVKAVSRKNFCNVNAWQKEHPTWRNHDSKHNDQYNKILVNSTSGSTEEEQKNSYERIIKNIVKETVIDKGKKNK